MKLKAIAGIYEMNMWINESNFALLSKIRG
jgi:hypothetical protein